MKLEIRQISKNFRRRAVLRDISLSAGPGMCVGILGQNGCGKSTFLSILAGILKADSGEALWDGADLLRDRELRRQTVGYVPQGTPLLQELTALDNLRLWYECSGYDLDRDLTEGVPAMLGVTDFLRVPVRRMSGGMKKRLSISCAVASRPSLLLLDEPSAALDPVCREQIGSYIADYRSRGGIALIATHDTQEMALCDSCFILRDGILVPYAYDGNVLRLVSELGAGRGT